MKYKIFLALLCGVGFTSLLSLLLNQSLLAYAAMLFLLPGSLCTAIIFRPLDAGPAAAILIANSVFYTGLFLSLLYLLRNRVVDRVVRRATLVLVAPVVILFTLACDPSLDPLWPSQMRELARVEANLANALPAGIKVDQARSILKLEKIDFSEEGNEIYGRSRIGAFEFPCGYELKVDLAFDSQGLLKNRQVQRIRICP